MADEGEEGSLSALVVVVAAFAAAATFPLLLAALFTAQWTSGVSVQGLHPRLSDVGLSQVLLYPVGPLGSKESLRLNDLCEQYIEGTGITSEMDAALNEYHNTPPQIWCLLATSACNCMNK